MSNAAAERTAPTRTQVARIQRALALCEAVNPARGAVHRALVRDQYDRRVLTASNADATAQAIETCAAQLGQERSWREAHGTRRALAGAR